MNHTPVDYVCFGNHETDLKIDELRKRIDQSEFAWINSNMPGMKYSRNIFSTSLGLKLCLRIHSKSVSCPSHLFIDGRDFNSKPV